MCGTTACIGYFSKAASKLKLGPIARGDNSNPETNETMLNESLPRGDQATEDSKSVTKVDAADTICRVIHTTQLCKPEMEKLRDVENDNRDTMKMAAIIKAKHRVDVTLTLYHLEQSKLKRSKHKNIKWFYICPVCSAKIVVSKDYNGKICERFTINHHLKKHE